MLSYTEMQTQFQDMTQDYSADALTFGKRNINIGQSKLEVALGSYQTEEMTPTIATISGTSTYATPASFIRLKEAYVTVGNIRYTMEQVFTEKEWQRIKVNIDRISSNITTHIFMRRDTFEIYPTPSTSDYLMTLIYEAGGKQLTADDYTTGTITTLANAGTTVTGSGTTFTPAMAGRYIRITNDGQWYKIATYVSATALTLSKAYEGLSISAGSEAYTIGQMPRTPDTTHHIPVLYACKQYYSGFKQNSKKKQEFAAEYLEDFLEAKRLFGKRSSSNFIPGNRNIRRRINPNYPPTRLMQ